MTPGSTSDAGQPARTRRVLLILVIPLAFALAAGGYSYLSRALRIPGVERIAPVDVLRERGADKLVAFCGPIFEPRFWPECTGDNAVERERGAAAFVEFCLHNTPFRTFGDHTDCLVEEQPPASLVDSPAPQDAVNAAIAASIALGAGTLLLPITRRRWAAAPREPHSSGSGSTG